MAQRVRLLVSSAIDFDKSLAGWSSVKVK